MNEELVYNSGRPRRTRASERIASNTSTPATTTPNPYKKPTYLVGRSNNTTPNDSGDEGQLETETPTPSRGRRRKPRANGSQKVKPPPPPTPAPAPTTTPKSTRGRKSRNTANSKATAETPTPTPTTSRKRGSGATWTGKSGRPECVASRSDRRSTGSSKKKRKRGYNSSDYHYGSDFDSDRIESEPDETVPSESESVDEPAEDDMALDEPLGSDSDISTGSHLQGLPSIPVPLWMDPEAIFDELEIPRSSDDLLLPRELLINAVAIYEPLRRFSNLVRLSPFRFEDFCGALGSEEQSSLLAEIHIQLLKSLIREDEANGTTFGPTEVKDSVQSVLFFMDGMTWAECLRSYVESDPMYADIYKILTSVEYPFCGPEIRIKILTWLIDLFIVGNSVRDLFAKDGEFEHEDHCRVCNRLGELVCCDTCPAVYHIGCIPLASGKEIPPDDWRCVICEQHQLSGISDCLSDVEKAGLLLRHEKLGYDRHGRTYWFLVRRILVESDDKCEVWYYSTRLQVEELLHRLDGENFEKSLVENILYHKDEIYRQMEITESVTRKVNTNHRKTYLEAENAFLTRIHEERELIKEQEVAEKIRIEEQARLAKKKEQEEKQRVKEEERVKKEDEKRRIREERLAKRNQIKLKQRLGNLQDTDEAVEQFLINDESKDSIMDHDEIKKESASENELKNEDLDAKPALENGDAMGEENFNEAMTQKLVPDEDPPPKIKEEAKMEVDEVKEEKPSLDLSLEPQDLEPLVKTSILPKIAAKSKSLNLEVDSEERMTRLRSTGLYKLGQEGNFKTYVNHYATDPLALSKNQHTEERDKRRVTSHKFSLTPASECKWSGVQQGSRLNVVATIRQTLLNMEVAIPITLMHCNWILLRKAWAAAVTVCKNSRDFSKALLAFSNCLRPSVFNPVWSEGVGHVKLIRTSAMEKEIRKKNEKAEKKYKDDEEDRLKLLPQFVKYSIPPKHQAWKQKGEEYRLHGNWGWIWLSNFRPAKPKEAKTMGLLKGPHKHVIQVKGNVGKVKTMLIDPDVYDKLMAKRCVSHDVKKSESLGTPSASPVPKAEPMEIDNSRIEDDVKGVLESLISDVVEENNNPTLTSLVKTEVNPPKPKSEVKTESKPEIGSSSPSRKFRTELINVSLGIVSANRILYPKIAHEVKSLDSLLERRLKVQSIEEKELLEEYGAEFLESLQKPPPVLETKSIVVKVDTSFPLAGGYLRQCYSYACQTAERDGKVNFEARCYSPMCRLKFVIREARRRKMEKERLAEFEKVKKARNDVEKRRKYNQSSTSEKVYLKKLPEQMNKPKDLIKYPPASKFYYNSTKKPSIFILPRHELMKLARSGGRTFNPNGYNNSSTRHNPLGWTYPCGRPLYKTTWQYRTIHANGIHSVALQLRLLFASVRWDDIQMKPLNPEGKNQITTDMEVITSEILNHRIVGRFLEVYQYLRRRHVVPIDAPKTIREVTPSRSGLRKRKRAESPDNAEPIIKEEWVDEDKFEVWEIKLYGEKLERKNDKKPEPPCNSTRSKTGITIKVPEKWDPSPKEKPEKERETYSKASARQTPEIVEPEIKSQRIVHLSKRDNHAKITNNNANKVPTPTASQQVLQQQSAAAAAAAAQGLPRGSSPGTKSIALTQATSPSGRKFFVTKPNVTLGAKPLASPKTGILKKASIVSPSPSIGMPNLNIAATALINATSTPTPAVIRQPLTAASGTPMTAQKIQLIRPPGSILKKISISSPSSSIGMPHSNITATALINATSTPGIIRQPLTTASGTPPTMQRFQIIRTPDGALHRICIASPNSSIGMPNSNIAGTSHIINTTSTPIVIRQSPTTASGTPTTTQRFQIIRAPDGALQGISIASPNSSIGMPNLNIAANALTNATSTSTPVVIRQPLTTASGSPTTTQKFQIIRTPDGVFQKMSIASTSPSTGMPNLNIAGNTLINATSTPGIIRQPLTTASRTSPSTQKFQIIRAPDNVLQKISVASPNPSIGMSNSNVAATSLIINATSSPGIIRQRLTSASGTPTPTQKIQLIRPPDSVLKKIYIASPNSSIGMPNLNVAPNALINSTSTPVVIRQTSGTPTTTQKFEIIRAPDSVLQKIYIASPSPGVGMLNSNIAASASQPQLPISIISPSKPRTSSPIRITPATATSSFSPSTIKITPTQPRASSPIRITPATATSSFSSSTMKITPTQPRISSPIRITPSTPISSLSPSTTEITPTQTRTSSPIRITPATSISSLSPSTIEIKPTKPRTSSPIRITPATETPSLSTIEITPTPSHPETGKTSHSPIRIEQSAKAIAAAHHKLISNIYKHKEMLKKDIFKRRALLEKDLLVEIQQQVSEELIKRRQPAHTETVSNTTSPVKSPRKRKFSEIATTTLKTSKGKPSLPTSKRSPNSRKSKSKKKKGGSEELLCTCLTPYDRDKFYVGCDKCDKWYHGECIGITEELSQCLSDYICDSCQNPPPVELFCLCHQPYDEKQFYIGCDRCDDWFHGKCVGVLPLEGSLIDLYVCPKCDSESPLNRSNLKQLTHADYPQLDKLLKQLKQHKSSVAFREPVDVTDVPNYYRVIKEPMDLQTIEQRVEAKCYSRLRDFIGDVMKIFDNCRSFNRPESQFYKSANLLETFFAQKIKLLRETLTAKN